MCNRKIPVFDDGILFLRVVLGIIAEFIDVIDLCGMHPCLVGERVGSSGLGE